jgi:lipoprotein-releasing system permease protein
MLGVATLIVVNAVMSGFSTKLKDRLHGVLSDVLIETDVLSGFDIPDEKDPLGRSLSPEGVVKKIMDSPAGPRIEAVSPTVEVFAILQFTTAPPESQTLTKPIRLIGVDPKSRAAVGGFSEYLVRQQNSRNPSFDPTPEALAQHEENKRILDRMQPVDPMPPKKPFPDPNAIPEPDEATMTAGMPVPKLYGAFPGYTIAHFRYRNEHGQVIEKESLRPGDNVTITTVSAGAGGSQMKPVWGSFLVTDYLRTEMSEYDQTFVYVPLEQLQQIRGMDGRCTAFQVKLKDYDNDKKFVTDELRKFFPPHTGARVATWEENQGALLAAIDVERSILNLLLFMIVGVAGFSILAIFTMIVSEKYRDIGILKSLGASNHGVLSIFLGYGLLLGVVGCVLGSTLGLWITRNINEIEQFLTKLTGKALFPREVYYFKEIPTNVDTTSVLFINIGAVLIAVVFSLLPAWRAARLHPVRALRFE